MSLGELSLIMHEVRGEAKNIAVGMKGQYQAKMKIESLLGILVCPALFVEEEN